MSNSSKKSFQTALTKATNTYMPMIADTLEDNHIEMTDYQRQCVMSAIAVVDNLLKAKSKTWGDVDQNSLADALTQTATLQLNPTANPAEVYYILRNKKNGNDWITEVEVGVEGDGNDSLLRRFGAEVKTVHKFWEVREGDMFVYPTYKGIEMSPPEWQPKGSGKVIRVVYPITKTNGEVEYLISEREDVDKNLKAHINNNLMNKTFGIAKSRFDASYAQKKEIDEKKREITDLFKYMSLDEMLTDKTLDEYISPAWKDAQSSESMIIRKMRNNVVKKYPKNFENAFLARAFNEASDETAKQVRRDVTENANQEVLDFDTKEKEETKEVEQPKQPEVKQQEVKVEEVVKADGWNEERTDDYSENYARQLTPEEVEELRVGKPEIVQDVPVENEQTAMFENLGDIPADPGF